MSDNITLPQRMVSAFAGALITSMVVTPLDVVRVRIQQQGMLPSSGTCCQPSGKVAHVFWEDPCFKDISCRVNPETRLNGTVDALMKISKNEGPSTLWRGLSLTLVMAVPASVVYYTGYEALRDNSPIKNTWPILNPLVCGSISRVLAATAIAPFELIKTRLQSIPSTNKSAGIRIMKDLLLESKMEFQRLGVKSLYRGLGITLWRDVPFSGIYWSTYEFYKKNLWIPFGNMEFFANSFIGGSVAGSIAALITHPFDVGKTRLQISNTTNSRMFPFLLGIVRKEGASALYAGLVPRMLKIAPSCAIMISTYELAKRFFSKSVNSSI